MDGGAWGRACCDSAQRGTPWACSCPLMCSLNLFVLQHTGSSEQGKPGRLVAALASRCSPRPPGEPLAALGWGGAPCITASSLHMQGRSLGWGRCRQPACPPARLLQGYQVNRV